MLNDKAYAEKHLRALHRELKELQHRQQTPPVHALHPPIQKGWKRHFVMTRAARERPDATVLGSILSHLNTVRYFWRPDFRYTRRGGARRGLVSIEQGLLALDFQRFEREPVYAGWQKYFRRDLVPKDLVRRHHQSWNSGLWNHPRFIIPRGDYVWAYAFRFPTLFELRVEKHWLTHCTEIEPDVVERIAEIEHWMGRRLGYQRLHRLKGRSQRGWRRPDGRLKGHAEQARREMRAHLGFLEDEAADHIPSISPCAGKAGGMWSAAPFHANPTVSFSIFAAVRTDPDFFFFHEPSIHRCPLWTHSSTSPPCSCSTATGRPSRRARPPTPSRR